MIRARPIGIRLVGLVGLVVASTTRSGLAYAEPTTWLSVASGVAGERNVVSGTEVVPVFSAALGVGTDPNGKFSVGGLFRTTTYFGIGTELALGPRLATAGFTRGSFGFAFDLGVALRPFGRSDYGRVPLQAGVAVGFPWGIQLETGLRLFDLSGQPSALGGYVTLGVDMLRFSVHRRGKTEQIWPNPAAAGAAPPAVTAIPGEADGDDGSEGLGPRDEAGFAPGMSKPIVPQPAKPTQKPEPPVEDGPEPQLR